MDIVIFALIFLGMVSLVFFGTKYLQDYSTSLWSTSQPNEKNQTSAITNVASPVPIHISVQAVPSRPAAEGWKAASVSVDQGKPFVVYYYRFQDRQFGWNTRSSINANYYYLADEVVPPAPNRLNPGPVSMGYYNGSFFCNEYIFEENYNPESKLEAIVLNNSQENGEKIFHQVFDELEKIGNPPPGSK